MWQIEVLPQNDSLLDFCAFNYHRGVRLQIQGDADNFGEKYENDVGCLGGRG